MVEENPTPSDDPRRRDRPTERPIAAGGASSVGGVGRTTAAEPAPTELQLTPELRDELAGWVVSGYPAESCGLLIGSADGDRIAVERVFLAKNLNVERAGDRYELDPADFLAADKAAREAGLEIVGIWHSHPDCPARPSTTDLAAAWEGYSYLIIAVSGGGDTDFRSWRLADGLFHPEAVLPAVDPPTAPELAFDRPLQEERTAKATADA